MFKRAYNLLFRNTGTITKTALIVGLFTLSAQLLGLVRDRLFAGQVGAGQELDLYYMAFKIPDFLYVSIATLASLTVLLPELTKHYGSGDDTGHIQAKQFVNQVFTALMLVLSLCSVVLFILMPILVPWLAPGFDTASQTQLVWLSRLMLLQPILIGVSNMFGSITQLFRKFWITSLSPVLYNIGVILGIVLFYPVYGMYGLVYGVIIGAVLHMGIQLPFLFHKKMVPKFTTTIQWKQMYNLARISLPRTLGLSVNNITTLIIVSFTSLLGAGAVSLFTLANNIFNVPINIIGNSLGTVSFPTLVTLFQSGDYVTSRSIMKNIIRNIILVSILAVIFVYFCKHIIIGLLLGSGNFTLEHFQTIAMMLMVFMVGLASQSSVAVLVRGWYAMGETKIPLYINLVSQISIISIVIISFYGLQGTGTAETISALLHITPDQVRLLSLPLAVTVGNTINAIWLYRQYMNKMKGLIV